MEAKIAMRSKWVKVCGRILCGAVLAVGIERGTAAQSSVPVNEISSELQVLAAHAANIFVGQIVSVQREGSVVEVRFRVEQTVRGSASGTFTMREWAGMWPAAQLRYAPGQRVLAFLNGASGAGFSSPVHGAEGLVPVVVQGTNAPQLLDVRRVAASVVRTPGTPLPTEANGAVSLSEALGWINPSNGTVAQRGLLPVPTRGKRPVMQRGTGPVDAGSSELQAVAAGAQEVSLLQ